MHRVVASSSSTIPENTTEPQEDVGATSSLECTQKAVSCELLADRSSPMTDDEINALLVKHDLGIPLIHAVKLQQIALNQNTIFGIRPVDKIVETLINEGYPTKELNVKGKSSNWGPMAGFIPVDQSLSKKENSPDAIHKQNETVHKGLAAGDFSATHLVISQSRIQELEQCGAITTQILDDQTLSITAVANRTGQSKSTYHFLALLKEKGCYFIDRQIKKTEDTCCFEPLLVLADKHLNEPLTADYDLFFVASHITNFGEADYRRNSDSYEWNLTTVNLSSSRSGSFSDKSLSSDDEADESCHQSSTSLGATDLKKIKPTGKLTVSDIFLANRAKSLGIISHRVDALISSINQSLDRGEHREMVHHGEDAGNPCSDIHDNFPATFFLPRELSATVGGKWMTFSPVTVVKDLTEHNHFVRVIKDNGFHFSKNPQWPNVRRSSFETARMIFEGASHRRRCNTFSS